MVAIAELGVAPIKRETVQERVYADLRYRLICGFFRPRQALKLMELAEAYGTSAMPVREALSRLVAERALSNAPNRSIVVPVLSQERIDDLRRVRKAVEGLAIRLACQAMTARHIDGLSRMIREQETLAEGRMTLEAVEANTKFHFAIYKLSGSEVLIPIIESLWLQFGPYLRHATFIHEDAAGQGLRFHRQMIEAFVQGNPNAAVAALEADVDLSFDLALTGLEAADTPKPKKIDF